MSASSDRWAQYRAEVESRIDCGRIFREIKQAKPSGNGHMVGLCPFHEDSKPSFGFDPKTGAWECFAGCGKGSVFDFVARQSGMDFKGALISLGQEVGLEPPSSNGGGPSQVKYSYCDEDGVELFQVVRTADKRFWQRKPNGRGGYVNGIRDVRRVLYRLPELLAEPAAPVVIVEGEKDVERLRQDGVVATTNPGGAGKWRQDYNQPLKGRDVVILPDNDDPGRRHARQVASLLHGVAASVRIVELPDLPDKGDVSDWLAAGHTTTDLEDLIARAPESDAPVGQRAQIMVSGRQFHDLIDETWRILLAKNDPPNLFVSAGQLSRLSAGTGVPRIQHADEPIAFGILARTADWTAQKGKSVVDARPPKDVARDIVANPHPDLPELEAVIATPVFGRNWLLLEQPGFHQDERLWLHRSAEDMEIEVPFRPTDDDLAAARSLLVDDLLVDFPFTAPSDRAHAVATLVLPFARRMFEGPTPIHLIEAPSPGSGKSLLADLASILATGEIGGSTTLTRDENESRKKLTALLSRGRPVICIDNVDGGLWSAQVAAAITADKWEDRILGKSRMVTFSNRALWIVTGNNPNLSMEIARRCIRIRLNPDSERPWLRTGFKHDPIRDWALKHRQELVRAICIAVRHWIWSGAPLSKQTVGSFEAWSRTIGGIVTHLGLPDFLADTEEFYDTSDPQSAEWNAFIRAWWQHHGGKRVTTSELLELAQSGNHVSFAYAVSSERAQLAKFGKALFRLRDRKLAGYRVVATRNSRRGSNDYRLVEREAQLFADQEVQ